MAKKSTKRESTKPKATPAKQVMQFTITLLDIEPPIWRRIQVPAEYTFWDLHVAIQNAIGWLGYHLHEFQIENPDTKRHMRLGIPDEDDWIEPKTVAGWNYRLAGFFIGRNKQAHYIYDFGDGWELKVQWETTLPRPSKTKFPRCIDGARAGPPEDCGGPYQYPHMLETLKKRRGREYKELIEWLAGPFDPDAFDPSEVEFESPKRWLNALLEDPFEEQP